MDHSLRGCSPQKRQTEKMRPQSVRWRRFSGSSLGVFCSLHKQVTVGVLSLAMLASFDAKAQTQEGKSEEKSSATLADDTEIALMDSVEVESSQAPLQQNMGARTTSAKIYGKLTDRQGRCIHYHTALDVIANKCAICRKFYSCYKCHNEKEAHAYGAISPEEASAVMCGVCGYQFSYSDYEQMGGSCANCGAHFNPRCSLHKCIYSQSPQKEKTDSTNQKK